MPYAMRTCEVCGDEYRPTYGDQRTCGRECGQVWSRFHRGEAPAWKWATHLTWRTCPDCGHAFVARSDSVRCRSCNAQPAHERRTCARCGGPVAYKKHYCESCRIEIARAQQRRVRRAMTSDQRWARKARLRANHAGVAVETVDRRRVFAEHGYRCHICGKAIDRTLPRLHAMAATIDHVRPLSRGGAHAYSNVKPAHRRCNALKGARTPSPASPGSNLCGS